SLPSSPHREEPASPRGHIARRLPPFLGGDAETAHARPTRNGACSAPPLCDRHGSLTPDEAGGRLIPSGEIRRDVEPEQQHEREVREYGEERRSVRQAS